MINSFLRILTWNANGLNQRVQELEVFLRENNTDIALISETHFTHKNYLKIKGYSAYWTTHPSERARGGTALLIKQNIKHFQQKEIKEPYLQATIVTIQHNETELSIGAIYCPPRHTIIKTQYLNVFRKLGPRFIIGGDFNVKHTAWGSRLITPGKGKELLSAVNAAKCEVHSSCTPTYWPTDRNKMPDVIDFFITKGINPNCIETEGVIDLSSDHTPVFLKLNATVITKKRRQNLTNKYTDWSTFRNNLDNLIDLHIRLDNINELEHHTQQFINNIRLAARTATPVPRDKPERQFNYPEEIRDLIKERRKIRRLWHRTRNPIDKRRFNKVSNLVNRLIKEYKQKCFGEYLSELGPEVDKDYSLWKATRRMRRHLIQVPPIKNAEGHWVRRDEEKVELFAQYLADIFQPHDIQSSIEPNSAYVPNISIKRFTIFEVAQEIDKNLKARKAPGVDELSPGLYKELSRKAIMMITYLFNACLRLKYIPNCFKIAQIIMLKKPDKPPEQVTSYRPISLLPTISKLFEKLLLKRLKPLINIPDFQFGFRNKHSTIDQIHRVTNMIEKAFEEKKYCPAIFLDVSQAFDRVWHEGLIHKISRILPKNICQLLESYISNRRFRVSYEEVFSGFYSIKAGVPQGSVLGPLLYLIYTADMPTTNETFIGAYADDTVIMAAADTLGAATKCLEKTLDKINQWTNDWKIKLNTSKSIHIIFTLRKINKEYKICLNGTAIPQAQTVKYLGMHMDSRLNWKHHVRQKAEQIKLKCRQIYWLVGYQSPLSLNNKRLVYESIIKPIWLYGIQVWGCTKQSNRNIIQKCQNKFLRLITKAYRYVSNSEIHKDLKIKMINEVVEEYAGKHKKRLLNHTNVEAIQLLDTTHETRRLKRTKPHELIGINKKNNS